MSRTTQFESLQQDLKYGVRTMLKNPGFSAAVVLTLALGANTAMFSVIRAVLLKPLAFRDPDRVVLVADGVTPIRFEELKTESRSYTDVGAFTNGTRIG
jgi:putative ABC transport system permease protein